MKNFLFERPEILGDLRSPVMISPLTILDRATSPTVLRRVVATAKKLSPDPFSDGMVDAYERGQMSFDESWQYADILGVLYATAEMGQPRSYLEIGTRRGRSVCMVAAASPSTNVVCADLWQTDYASNENPGPEFVQSELSRVGHTGSVEFISGDSHVTIPKYFLNNPRAEFDLVTVDGDHSVEGAMDDLQNVVAHLAIGGVLVFDDIDNPYCPGLLQVWNKFLACQPGLVGTIRPNPLGFGVALAIRVNKSAKLNPGWTSSTLRSWFKLS